MAHYDTSNEFFQLWIGPELIYSCALFEDGDDLARAQVRKLDHHIAAAGAELFSSAPWPSLGPECRMAVGGALLYLDNARMITNLLYSDVLERYPALRFVSVESGVGWIPFVLEACEYQWDQMVPSEARHHELRPTEKFRRNISGQRALPDRWKRARQPAS